ncbi:MAG: hypothetical protein A2544_00130 [Candidatus Zambryskibacteria bacterium RIFOXYD2_FULL_43_10]|uniref:DUF86 domain-containing protein n=1 Tax=Candidatus Zambryskibacteria bacterium RIFOXYD2_FULL_43_10 TaxID=1802782 RepID=A0A1G2V8J7_9BACT|nr:MAG: hypothetical protein A2544_00130 [Candidatus Zambryskibacteria bacterium RIFOXYD2_FULL_43_10]
MKDDGTYVDQILDSIRKLELYIIDYDKDEFIKDEKTQSAVLMQLTVIGEISKKISEETKSKIDVPWKKIMGFRDKTVHAYFNLDIDVIWETIQTRIPELKEKLSEYK